MRLNDDAMLIFAKMMYEECQKRNCPECIFFIKGRAEKCLFCIKPVMWDDLPNMVEEVKNGEWKW